MGQWDIAHAHTLLGVEYVMSATQSLLPQKPVMITKNGSPAGFEVPIGTMTPDQPTDLRMRVGRTLFGNSWQHRLEYLRFVPGDFTRQQGMELQEQIAAGTSFTEVGGQLTFINSTGATIAAGTHIGDLVLEGLSVSISQDN